MYETAFAVVAILCGSMELLIVARYEVRTSAISQRQAGYGTRI